MKARKLEKKEPIEASRPREVLVPSTLFIFGDSTDSEGFSTCFSILTFVPRMPSINPDAGLVISPPPIATATSFEYGPGAHPLPARTLK